MLGFIFFGLAAAALIFEILSLRHPLKDVSVSYDFDMLMAEPGEKITLSYQISNNGNLPVFYLGLSFSFDSGVEICEDVWAPLPPSNNLTMAGADIVLNCSASNELIGKHFRPNLRWALALAVLFVFSVLHFTQVTAFLYFQF